VFRSTFSRILAVPLLLTAGAAGAYVMPQGAVLRHMASAREDQRLSAVRVEGTLVFSGAAAGEAGGTGEVQSDARVAMRLPGRCRLDASSADGGRLAVVDVNGQLRTEGPSVRALAAALSELCALFGARSAADGRGALESHLRARGVEPRTSSLARFGGQVAYVLGGKGEKDAQFWVFKDSFLPARMRWTEAGSSWDVRFVDYNSPAGDWFPRVVEVARDGEQQARFTTLSGEPHASLPDRLFSLGP
jgi:hypothetical protein